MHYSINDDILFDFVRREQTVTTLEKNKKAFSVSNFLDDISEYMENNKKELADKYLSLAVLAVGTQTFDVGNFLYGFLIGKYISDKKVKITSKVEPISKEILRKHNKEMDKELLDPFKHYFKGNKEDDDGKKGNNNRRDNI